MPVYECGSELLLHKTPIIIYLVSISICMYMYFILVRPQFILYIDFVIILYADEYNSVYNTVYSVIYVDYYLRTVCTDEYSIECTALYMYY